MSQEVKDFFTTYSDFVTKVTSEPSLNIEALKKSMESPPGFIDAVAVMVDTRSSLEIGNAATLVENAAYVDSWRSPGGET